LAWGTALFPGSPLFFSLCERQLVALRRPNFCLCQAFTRFSLLRSPAPPIFFFNAPYISCQVHFHLSFRAVCDKLMFSWRYFVPTAYEHVFPSGTRSPPLCGHSIPPFKPVFWPWCPLLFVESICPPGTIIVSAALFLSLTPMSDFFLSAFL